MMIYMDSKHNNTHKYVYRNMQMTIQQYICKLCKFIHVWMVIW